MVELNADDLPPPEDLLNAMRSSAIEARLLADEHRARISAWHEDAAAKAAAFKQAYGLW